MSSVNNNGRLLEAPDATHVTDDADFCAVMTEYRSLVDGFIWEVSVGTSAFFEFHLHSFILYSIKKTSMLLSPFLLKSPSPMREKCTAEKPNSVRSVFMIDWYIAILPVGL